MNSELANALANAAQQAEFFKTLPSEHFNNIIFQAVPEFQAPYQAVKTWEDLLVTNLAFLHDKFIPFYYSEFLGAEDAGHRASIQTLIDLHLYGIFTHNGQGNTCQYDDESSEEQRPYVDASIPRGMWPAIKAQLDKFRDVAHYVAYDCASNSVVDTTLQPSDYSDKIASKDRVKNVYTLTRGRGARSDPWASQTSMGDDRSVMCWFINDAEPYPHVQDMFKRGCYEVVVVMREFCSPKLADAVLLQCVKRAGFKPRIQDPYRDMKVDAATKLQALARRRSAQRRVQGMRVQQPVRGATVATFASVPTAPVPHPAAPGSISPATVALFAYFLGNEKRSPRKPRRRRSRRSRRNRK